MTFFYLSTVDVLLQMVSVLQAWVFSRKTIPSEQGKQPWWGAHSTIIDLHKMGLEINI